ncbi:MAG: ABC transporter permease subunit [Magnetococcales bacterium]|nr:ABC transporter permease subunit [Magnetococcales bacterium]MBF0114536.1 ABC transporter permease subunit [Magnetococcales bacterium]
MRAILTIAHRELRSMFLSPLAWTLLAVLFAISAYMFMAAVFNYQIKQVQFQAYGEMAKLSLTDWTISPMLGNAAVLLLLIMPMVTMRLFADEKRRGTWAAIASSPLSSMEIILGKYLGLLYFLAITIALLALPPLLLFVFGKPDPGQTLSGLLGLFLLAASFGAVGLATSSATDNPVVAALSAFGLLLLLWVASWMGEAGGSALGAVLNYLSITNHYQNFLTGVISSTDLIYFLLLAAVGLLFARQQLAAERIQG